MPRTPHLQPLARATGALAAALTLLASAAGTARGQPVTTSGAAMASPMSQGRMTQMMRDWHPAAQEAVRTMTQKYGPPMEMTATTAVWGKTGPWKRTVVFAKEYAHAFPMPHTDVMQQWVDYKAPVDMYDELAQYDGSVVLERTAGEMSARCDKEGANLLALNLMHEIVTGKLTAEEARKSLSETMSAYAMNRSAPYAEAFQFELPQEQTADKDETTIAGAMVRQGAEKAKDIVG